MSEFEQHFTELKAYIDNLYRVFISQFIPTKPGTKPDEYEHQVKAYCILCHAAFEEYFENVALRVMIRSIDEWLKSRKYTDTLITLVLYYGLKLELDENESNPEKKVFDYLRPLFDQIKTRFSEDVHNNHGISLKYLRNLLIPVAIDIKDDIKLKNALQQLAKERGLYAHRQTVKKILAPEDAVKYVNDCLELCEDVKQKAESKFTL